MNKVVEEMTRGAFETQNSDMNLTRHPLDQGQYASVIVQNRWMGWQQATEFWIQENAPTVRKRR